MKNNASWRDVQFALRARKRWQGLLLTIIAVLIVFVATVPAKAQAGECSGTPAGAAMSLPQPLGKWATIVCTPYGHIISNKSGWIWSREGSDSPVFIPSQLVQRKPALLGNKSYFTTIDIVKVDGTEFKNAYSAFHGNFLPDTKSPDGYRLDVTSIFGRSMMIYFFDYGSHAWGIWCPSRKCDPASRFMIIDMTHTSK